MAKGTTVVGTARAIWQQQYIVGWTPISAAVYGVGVCPGLLHGGPGRVILQPCSRSPRSCQDASSRWWDTSALCNLMLFLML
jgi:hypothetical protein